MCRISRLADLERATFGGVQDWIEGLADVHFGVGSYRGSGRGQAFSGLRPSGAELRVKYTVHGHELWGMQPEVEIQESMGFAEPGLANSKSD